MSGDSGRRADAAWLEYYLLLPAVRACVPRCDDGYMVVSSAGDMRAHGTPQGKAGTRYPAG